MPMRDRLEEFHQQVDLLEKGDSSSGKPGRVKSKKMDGAKNMQSFLGAASKIEDNVSKMKEDVSNIRKLQQDMLSVPFPEKSDVTKYESLSEQVRHDATTIGSALKDLEKKYDLKDLSDDSAFKRMKDQQLGTLSTELNLSTNEFFKIQAEYMDKMKDRLRRQITARGDCGGDDSKINKLLEQDNYNVFTDNYVMDVNDAETTLRDLDERKKDILQLEKGVTEVNQLFKDMNLLVATQGEKIETIEQAVETANVHVEGGKTQLGKAGEYRKRARRKKCCCIGILIGVIVVVGIIITIMIIESS